MIVFLLVAPLVALLAMALMVRHPLCRAWTAVVLGLLAAGASCWALAAGVEERVAIAGWAAPWGIELRLDAAARLMVALNAVVFLAAALYQAGREAEEPRSHLLHHLCLPLLLFALDGLYLTSDFFNFYVFFELAAATSFVLVASGHRRVPEALWKYVVQSMLASTTLLAAVALVYGATGTLAMEQVARADEQALAWTVPLVLFAFLLKASIFPFHFWQADAHAASSTAGSCLLAGLFINIGIYGIARFWPLLYGDGWRDLVLGFGVASLLFGAVAAWRQRDLKRLLGFSSTSQLGFVLVGLGIGTPAGTAAALLFLVAHALAKGALFLGSGVVGHGTDDLTLGRLGALGRPWLGGGFLCGFGSLIGLPPSLGFLGKVALIVACVQAEAWVALVAVASGSLLTLGYAVRCWQALFWSGGSHEAESAPALSSVALASLAIPAGFGGAAGWALWDVCAAASAVLHAAAELP